MYVYIYTHRIIIIIIIIILLLFTSKLLELCYQTCDFGNTGTTLDEFCEETCALTPPSLFTKPSKGIFEPQHIKSDEFL